MSEIGVVGREQFTLGFRLAGIRNIRNCEDNTLEQNVRAAINDANMSILVMETSDVSKLSERLREEVVGSVKPTLVSVGLGEDNTLREKVKQAVGVDLW